MALEVDLRCFLDEQGNPLNLTEQAEKVFIFLSHIVSAVSTNMVKEKHQKVNVELMCNMRANNLDCEGDIEATHNINGHIDWHCNTCEASGSISHWQFSHWDKQIFILH